MLARMNRPSPGSGRIELHLPGEVGIWVFVLGDMAIFALFFAAYMVDRSVAVELYNASQQALNRTFGVINTLLLLTSSLFVVSGVSALRAGRARVAQRLLLGAMLCGLGFAVAKVVEYGEKLGQDITPYTNGFYMYYFMLTGIHFLHLTIGMGVLVLMFRAARQRQVTDEGLAFVECGATYWHMVDLLWIVLFPLLYFVR
ncbi:MAG: cytochrome c oxidase subunit 3 [Sinimarinibacterium sp.]|jgi:nitric oxide reductase NorE protein